MPVLGRRPHRYPHYRQTMPQGGPLQAASADPAIAPDAEVYRLAQVVSGLILPPPGRDDGGAAC